ncbi:MAG: hypothetical protein LBF62_11380 [Tannerellaceae bacterium]|jgi:hypothetical protein|nr:hypothetical protein [Tannerellaceae bacterium]
MKKQHPCEKYQEAKRFIEIKTERERLSVRRPLFNCNNNPFERFSMKITTDLELVG